MPTEPFNAANHELVRAMQVENAKHSWAIGATTILTCLGITASLSLPTIGTLIFCCGALLANVSMVVVSRAWHRVESARGEVHRHSIMNTTAESRAALESCERARVRFRRSRLVVAMGALAIHAIGDICFAMFYWSQHVPTTLT